MPIHVSYDTHDLKVNALCRLWLAGVHLRSHNDDNTQHENINQLTECMLNSTFKRSY